MSTYDKASRLRTNLHTADGCYDQGLAVSQAIINSSFGKLYDRYPAMQTMSYDSGIAKIEGEMLPSRLIIPEAGMNLAKIIHQLRFKTGTLTIVNNPNPIKLDKFVIGVKCDLDLQFVKERPDETDKEKRQREFIEKEIKVPGDYRLERLYSKFTSAGWNDFDLYNSQYYDADGNPMTYEEWLQKDPTAAAAFGIMLSLYATDMEAQGLSTLGVKITLPDLPPETTPTFIPTDMIHQIYPYRDEQGHSEYSDSPNGDRNCLLYLEVVKKADGTDGQFPDAKQVGYSGNFCYPSLNSVPGVDGTFLLGGPLFMGRYLLPQLQMLNEASSMYPYQNTYSGHGGWAFPMDIGSDPRYPNYENAGYAFHQSSDGLKWVYEKDVDNSTSVSADSSAGWWWSSDHWSKATTTITWQPGSDLCITVEGHYEYYRGITFAENQQLTNPSTYSKFKTGTLTVAGSQTPVKLDNWEVGVLCDLGQQFVREYAEETAEEKEQRTFVEKQFSVPGDYKLQRLYAKLTSAQWNKFDVQTSKFFDDKGNSMTYEEWQKKDMMGATTFGATLSLYGADLQKHGLSTLAVSIILSGLPQEIIPTFTPTNVTQQIYPYRDQNGESEYGDTVKGNRNCLLFLEVVKKEDGSDGQLPDARQVGYNGNFCYPPAGQPGVDGTFVLGGELFLTRYLLRQLQAINEASSIYAYRNTYDSVGGWAFPIDIGRDPRHQNYKHNAYKFVKSSEKQTWVYNKRSDNSTPAAPDGSGHWWSSDHWSEARTVVSWQPGKAPYAKVEGEYTYYRGITFANNKELTNPSTYSKEKYRGKWALGVRVVVEDDALQLKLESTEDLDFLVTGEVEASPNLGHYENQKYKIRDSVKHEILSRIPVLRNNLREGFQGDHQFTFPVTGQLAFQDLTFNNEGDVLAGLVWKDVDGPIVVQPPDLTDVNKLEPYPPLTDTVNFGPISWVLEGHRKY